METTNEPGRVEGALGKVGAKIDRLLANQDDVVARVEKGVEDLKPKLQDLKVQVELGRMDLRDRLMPLLDQVQRIVDDLRVQAEKATDPPGSERISSEAQSEVSKVSDELRSEDGLN
jgi:hypothetical protein